MPARELRCVHLVVGGGEVLAELGDVRLQLLALLLRALELSSLVLELLLRLQHRLLSVCEVDV